MPSAACGLDRDAAVDSGRVAAGRAAAESVGLAYADLTDHFCSATRCDPVVGDVLLYRDTSHLTPSWSALMAGPLGAASLLRHQHHTTSWPALMAGPLGSAIAGSAAQKPGEA